MDNSWPDPTSPTSLAALTERIRAEYREAPGLRLTPAQAARFWGLDAVSCEDMFHALQQSGFLDRGPDGSYRFAERR